MPSWPVHADKPPNCPEGTFPLEYVLKKGYKHWLGQAAEARSIAGLVIYLAWSADTVAMARLLGFREKDPYWALIHILDELRLTSPYLLSCWASSSARRRAATAGSRQRATQTSLGSASRSGGSSVARAKQTRSPHGGAGKAR